jgi:hypothetical protein
MQLPGPRRFKMFTALTITRDEADQWSLSDGPTLVGLVNGEGTKFNATYMACTEGDRFEGEELGEADNGIDAIGLVMERFAVTPHCYNCQRAHGGFHEGRDGKHYCSPCAIELGQ